MSGTGKENIFEGLADKPECRHRALQLCKEQDVVLTYVCGRCSAKFEVKPMRAPDPGPKEPMFKNPIPWGLRGRQA